MTQHVCSVQQVAQTPGVEIPNESLVIAAHEVFERHSAQLFVLVGFERSFHLLSASVAAQIPAVHNPISSQNSKTSAREWWNLFLTHANDNQSMTNKMG